MHIMNFDSIMSRKLSQDEIVTRKGTVIKKNEFQKYAWTLGKNHKFPYNVICSLCEKYDLAKPSKKNWD